MNLDVLLEGLEGLMRLGTWGIVKFFSFLKPEPQKSLLDTLLKGDIGPVSQKITRETITNLKKNPVPERPMPDGIAAHSFLKGIENIVNQRIGPLLPGELIGDQRLLAAFLVVVLSKLPPEESNALLNTLKTDPTFDNLAPVVAATDMVLRNHAPAITDAIADLDQAFSKNFRPSPSPAPAYEKGEQDAEEPESTQKKRKQETGETDNTSDTHSLGKLMGLSGQDGDIPPPAYSEKPESMDTAPPPTSSLPKPRPPGMG